MQIRCVFASLIFTFGCNINGDPNDSTRLSLPSSPLKMEAHVSSGTDSDAADERSTRETHSERESMVADFNNNSENVEKTDNGEVRVRRTSVEKRLRNAKFGGAKPVSSRSKSVRLFFPDGGSAIFKPILKGDSSARLEVAYYRLATLMGLEMVPVSVMRPIYPDRFEQALIAKGKDAANEFLDAMERDNRGRVWGAMIEWLGDLNPIGGEDDRGRVAVTRLFKDDIFRPFRRHLSNAILLDYLFGNWDRFSGGNLFRVGHSNRLALIDHNEAFYKLNVRQQEKLDESLNAVTCLTPELVSRMRQLNRNLIVAAVKSTDWKGDLLRQVEIGNILIRKETLLKFIEMKIATANGTSKWICE